MPRNFEYNLREEGDACVELQITHQDDNSIIRGDFAFQSIISDWEAESRSKPEIQRRDGDRTGILFLQGTSRSSDDSIVHCCFRSREEVETFKEFLEELKHYLNGGAVKGKAKPKIEGLVKEDKPYKSSRFVKVEFQNIKNRKKRAYAEKLSGEGRLIELIAYLRSLEGVQAPWNFDINKLHKAKGVDKLKDKKSGFYVQLYNKRFDIFASHAPSKVETGYGRYLGIEIECLIPRTENYRSSESFASWVQEKSGQKIKYLSIVDDGSLRPGDGFFGAELRLLTYKDDFTNLRQTCDLLKSIGAKVNSSCGLHVHLDMRSTASTEEAIDAMNLKARRIGNTLDILKLMIPSSRRENSFCKLSVGKLDSEDRYFAVNKSAYQRHKTLEIRLHSGTTNFRKIKNWCDLLVVLADCKKLTRNSPDTIDKFFSLVELSDDLKAYVLDRVETFKSPQNAEADELPPLPRFEYARGNNDPFITVDGSVPAEEMRNAFISFCLRSLDRSRYDDDDSVNVRALALYNRELSRMTVASGRHVFADYRHVRQHWNELTEIYTQEYRNGRVSPPPTGRIDGIDISNLYRAVMPSIRPITTTSGRAPEVAADFDFDYGTPTNGEE